MKTLALSTLLTAACTWGTSLIASAAEPNEAVVKTKCVSGGDAHVVLVASEAPDGEVDGPHVVVKMQVDGKAGTDGAVRVLRTIGDGEPHVLHVGPDDARQHISLIASDEDVDGGWLGVQLSSTQMKGEEGADIVISNVAIGSAAAAAGFQQNDVVVEVNDQNIRGDLGALVSLVKEAGVGARMKFTVLRDGQSKTLVATLGQRTGLDKVEWQYETDAMLLHDELRTDAKVLLKGDGGEWRFKSLGDDFDFDVLPEDIAKLIPKIQTRTMNVVVGDDNEKHVAIFLNLDGKNLSIKTTDDGIEVTRTDPDTGEDTVTVYDDEDALAAGDEEAFDLFRQTGNEFVVDLDNVGDGHAFTFSFEADGDGPHAVWLEKLEEQLAEESEGLTEAMERLKNLQFGVDVHELGQGNTFFEFLHEKARQTIRENPDGTIDVITRKADNELVKRYADEADLQTRNSDAYETYLDLQDGD